MCAHPCVRVDVALDDELLGAHDVRAAAEGQDAHDLGLLGSPLITSKLVMSLSGGPAVRLSTSAAWFAA